ncbi:MAG: enoyl-CoA hydratase-related protein [Rhodobacteraceae bacterium]|nr:enoyl-CoA hydratase-related protein [Paracoccaceae bacterium]
MTVEFAVADRVATVTIDRPDRMNAVNKRVEDELEKIWRDLETRTDVSCVVLTGAGDKAFCVGADMKDVESEGASYWLESKPNGFGGIAFRRSLDLPVVARVNGYALGGGFEMVLGCDIVIAAEHAKFGLPEGRVGRMPMDGGMVMLPRKIPFNQAMGMLFTGRHCTADEMRRFGIVNEIAPIEEIDKATRKWTRQIAALAPLSLRAIKQTINRTMHLSPSEAQCLKLPAVVDALCSEDGLEGVRAFQEKRAPNWRGR